MGAGLADIFQSRNFGSINGMMSLGYGLGGVAGPWFGGFVFDARNSYSVALLVAILVTCFACAAMWGAAPGKTKKLRGIVVRDVDIH